MQLYTPVFLTTLFRSWSKVGVNSTIGNHDNAQPSPSINIPLLDQHKLQAQYRHAQQRSFLLDYDGTLTPIVDDPEAAIPSKKLLRTLQALASDPKNAVWIISGRDQAFLDQWLGSIEQIGLSAEHGAFVRKPGSTTWDDVERDDLGWQKEIVEMFQAYTERTPGSFVERKRVAVTWHFRKADLDEGARHAVECRTRLEDMIATKNWDLEVMNGKMNLEVRPVSVSKGDIVKKLVESRNGAGDLSLDFVLCLGDDFTDEDMFRSLRSTALPVNRVFSVAVGPSSKPTIADWYLPNPSDVVDMLVPLSTLTLEEKSEERQNLRNEDGQFDL